MAKYTRARNVEQHMAAIEEFEANIPRNRKEWSPPVGYELRADEAHKTRKNYYPAYAEKVGTTSNGWRCIAKATSQWSGRYTGGQYTTYITTLWAKEGEAH